MNELPGTPQPNIKDLEAQILLLRRKLRALEDRVEQLEGS